MTCKYPGCVANANTDRDHCTVHYPENVVARAESVINQFFWPFIERKIPYVEAAATPAFQLKMTRLRDRILKGIKGVA